LEVGSSVRASRIAYNRLNGSFANIQPENIDWKKALKVVRISIGQELVPEFQNGL
jgi:hypothetical protein